MYNADNMHSFLGSEASDEQAQIFADYLLSHGWELVEGSDGQYVAYHEGEDGEEMTEIEWQEALLECFR